MVEYADTLLAIEEAESVDPNYSAMLPYDPFVVPNNAKRNDVGVNLLCPKDKYERRKGLSSSQTEFRGLCRLGEYTLIACYGKNVAFDRYEYYTAGDIAKLCLGCPYARKYKTPDPYYLSIFDGDFVAEMLDEYIDYSAKHFCYFVSDGSFVKIGVAKDPLSRLSGIQTGNPNKVELLYLIPCKSERAAREAEKRLHFTYRVYARQGEWFDILDKLYKGTFEKAFAAEKWLKAGD